MKILIAALLLTSTKLWAHCPNKIEVDGETYCTRAQWQAATKKVEGKFVDLDQVSPHLIPMRTAQPKWVYSNVKFMIWKDGDASHEPVKLEGLNIFPYMIMDGGHHHGASHEAIFNEEDFTYDLGSIRFHEMRGCWSFRYAFTEDENLKDSKLLLILNDFTNLTEEQKQALAEKCTTELNSGSGSKHGHAHHGHH